MPQEGSSLNDAGLRCEVKCVNVTDSGLDTSPSHSRSTSPLFDQETENVLNELVQDANGGMFDDVESEGEFEFENENTVDLEKMFEEMEKSMPSALRARLMGVDGKPCWEKYVNEELDELQNEPGFD